LSFNENQNQLRSKYEVMCYLRQQKDKSQQSVLKLLFLVTDLKVITHSRDANRSFADGCGNVRVKICVTGSE
jgi:hypothetical protein